MTSRPEAFWATSRTASCDNTVKPRFHALDSLRAVAMLLGIVIHALQAHAMLQARPGDGAPGGIWLAEFIHAWRMLLFFLISGIFCGLCWPDRRWPGPRRPL